MTAARLALYTLLHCRGEAWPALLTVAAAGCALRLGAAAVPLLALVAAAITADTALRALARRRQLATLRALGMTQAGLVLMLELEALWISAAGSLLGMGAAGMTAWLSGRYAILWRMLHGEGALRVTGAAFTLSAAGTLLAAVLGVSVLAALVPALRAARHDVALALAPLPPHQDR